MTFVVWNQGINPDMCIKHTHIAYCDWIVLIVCTYDLHNRVLNGFIPKQKEQSCSNETFFRRKSLRWRQNERDGVSNHQSQDCLPNRLFRRRSKKTSKLRVTGLCVGNSPVTGEFPTQRASNAEIESIVCHSGHACSGLDINVLTTVSLWRNMAT